MSTQAQWRKSSRSAQVNACVEIATNVPGQALIRDSKVSSHSPVLTLTPAQLTGLLTALKADRHTR